MVLAELLAVGGFDSGQIGHCLSERSRPGGPFEGSHQAADKKVEGYFGEFRVLAFQHPDDQDAVAALRDTVVMRLNVYLPVRIKVGEVFLTLTDCRY
jgi:hypothetical protein